MEPQPDFIQQEMSKARVMCSRVLGEEVEQARITLETCECDEETVGLIKLSKCPENDDMLKKSLICVAYNPSSSNSILYQILAEGVANLTIKSLGGPLHIITFDSIEEKEAMLESKWLEKWYMEVRNAARKTSSLWRETWITIYGVPLHAWSYDNFYKIGCIFEKVLSVNQQQFEYTKILISTDCLFKINCKMALDMEGDKSKIHIWESPLSGPENQKNPPLPPENQNSDIPSSPEMGLKEPCLDESLVKPPMQKQKEVNNDFPSQDINCQATTSKNNLFTSKPTNSLPQDTTNNDYMSNQSPLAL